MKLFVVVFCLTVAATTVLAEDRGLQKRDNWQKVKVTKKQPPANRGYQMKTDNEGDAKIIFGDGTHGRRPSSGSQVRRRYRSGGGKSGNKKTGVTKNGQSKSNKNTPGLRTTPSQTKVLILAP